VIYEEFDVVVVPFPFVNRAETKRRPALVLSKKHFNRNGHTVLAMITTSAHHPWPGDQKIKQRESTGLTTPCIVRLKLFTLDNRLILKRIGHLADADCDKVTKSIRANVI
jgi:mRNA interferase MazF